jgi:hypothetical protein
MERSDERLSTRDIASPTGDTEGERDAAQADAPPADTAAVPPDRADRETDEEAGARRFDPERDTGDVVIDEPTGGDAPARESIAEPTASGESAATPAAAAAATSGTADDIGDRGDTDDGGDRAAATTTGTTDTPADTRADAETGDEPSQLLADSDEFQRRWEEIQVRFVDEPRGAVEDADALVATVMQRLAEGFAQERERLEAQWGRGEDISTEDLRVALQRYRSFFQRLLST